MTDLNEKLAQEAAELINGGEWRDGKWYSDGQRDAWRRALKPASDRIEKLEATLRFYACDCKPDCGCGIEYYDGGAYCGRTAREALEGKDE
jgi:hypothetical protein